MYRKFISVILALFLTFMGTAGIAEEQLELKAAYANGVAIQQPLVGKLEIVKLDKKG